MTIVSTAFRRSVMSGFVQQAATKAIAVTTASSSLSSSLSSKTFLHDTTPVDASGFSGRRSFSTQESSTMDTMETGTKM